MKLAFVDLETTGLDPLKHEIIEIGMVVVDDSDFTIIDQVNIKVKPEHPELGEPAAFKVNGYSEEEWDDAMTLHQAMIHLSEHADKATFLAYNATFDWAFIHVALEKTGHANPFHYHRIDVLSVAWARIPHDKMQSWALKACCAYLHIPREPQIHRALNGAMCAYQVYRELMRP